MQVCEQNTGSIALVKTTDKRRMGELKMEASVNESIKKKLMIIQRWRDQKAAESRCSETGRDKEASYVEIAMGGLR